MTRRVTPAGALAACDAALAALGEPTTDAARVRWLSEALADALTAVNTLAPATSLALLRRRKPDGPPAVPPKPRPKDHL